MKLTWDKDSNAYAAVEKIILDKYGSRGESIVVNLQLKYSCEDKYHFATTILLNDGIDCFNPDWIWEYDWWEGEQDVILLAAAPISEVELNDQWCI